MRWVGRAPNRERERESSSEAEDSVQRRPNSMVDEPETQLPAGTSTICSTSEIRGQWPRPSPAPSSSQKWQTIAGRLSPTLWDQRNYRREWELEKTKSKCLCTESVAERPKRIYDTNDRVRWEQGVDLICRDRYTPVVTDERIWWQRNPPLQQQKRKELSILIICNSYILSSCFHTKSWVTAPQENTKINSC